jgi:CBS domain-containing protein
MDVIDIDDPMDEIVPVVIDTAHSRFPVVDGDRDNVLGILLAKDLLRIQTEENFDLRDWLRPAVFIPESKRLNVLLREFRVSRNHMAIVVNEYGGVAGLVTIEDVLEQIVGDIEDEYDFDEAHDNIRLDSTGRYRVKAVPRSRISTRPSRPIFRRGIRHRRRPGPAPPRPRAQAQRSRRHRRHALQVPARRQPPPLYPAVTPPPKPKPVLKTLLAERTVRYASPAR